MFKLIQEGIGFNHAILKGKLFTKDGKPLNKFLARRRLEDGMSVLADISEILVEGHLR